MVDDEHEGVGERLEHVLGHVDADEGGGAAHAGHAVGEHVTAHLEAVDQHGSHAGRGRKAAARGGDDADL